MITAYTKYSQTEFVVYQYLLGLHLFCSLPVRIRPYVLINTIQVESKAFHQKCI